MLEDKIILKINCLAMVDMVHVNIIKQNTVLEV